jgi:RimJ/RimL family protein N-acetyltransferase
LIRTERLLLRKPTPADLEDPPAFLADPRVVEFLGGVDDDLPGVVRRWLEEWDTYQAGKLIVETAAGERIGRVGFNFYDPAGWLRSTAPDARPELTWALAYEQWGRGYATEAAIAVRDWFDAPLISLIAPENLRSQRLAERLGATPGETVEVPGVGAQVVWEHPL